MSVELREISMENFRECIGLAVSEAQRGFVAANIYSLAEAKADDVSIPLAIYANDRMVGFIMYDFEPKQDLGYITRLMVDARYQGQGHGRAAMSQVIERLRSIPACRRIQTSFAPDNRVADRLYASLGFARTGEVVDGEIVVEIEIPR